MIDCSDVTVKMKCMEVNSRIFMANRGEILSQLIDLDLW